MAISNSTNWRVRGSGNNANGGGFDAAVSGTLSTTTTGSLSSGTTTVTVASATGWPSSGNYYACISVGTSETGGVASSEIVLVTAGQGTTTWTVTRGQLGTTGIAFASGVFVTNELSRCNTAPLSGTAAVSTASTTFVDAGATFDLTCVGNTIWLASGTGSPTAGAYTIQSRTNSTTVVLDRASGTYTAGVWKMGGAWADFKTNVASSANIKPGNVIFIRGGGSGAVGSPDYTVSQTTYPLGDTTNGPVGFVGEGPRPYIAGSDCLIFNLDTGSGTGHQYFQFMYLYPSGSTFLSLGIIGNLPNNRTGYAAYDVICDQNGLDVGSTYGTLCITDEAINCEVFSSTANSGSAGSGFGIYTGQYGARIINCNIHDCWGHGVNLQNMATLQTSIVAFCRGDGIHSTDASTDRNVAIFNSTIDSNHGNGIVLDNAANVAMTKIWGSFITNHTSASTYGIKTSTGTLSQNDRQRGSGISQNWFYNNTSNALNLTVGGTVSATGFVTGDSVGIDPQYANVSTEDYTPGTNAKDFIVYQFPKH